MLMSMGHGAYTSHVMYKFPMTYGVYTGGAMECGLYDASGSSVIQLIFILNPLQITQQFMFFRSRVYTRLYKSDIAGQKHQVSSENLSTSLYSQTSETLNSPLLSASWWWVAFLLCFFCKVNCRISNHKYNTPPLTWPQGLLVPQHQNLCLQEQLPSSSYLF